MDSCSCELTRRNIVYVGKAVSLRNRLQSEFFNTPTRRIPPWVDLYMDWPHHHILFASVWFVEKPLLDLAESVLIDLLNPRHNVRRKVGFSNPSIWPFRWPDLEGITCCDFEPAMDRKPVSCPLNQKSGVYTWHYGDLKPKESGGLSLVEAFISGQENPAQPILPQAPREQSWL